MEPFKIEKDKLTCNKCNSELLLIKDKQIYDHCSCYDLRLIRCHNQIHITSFSSNKDYWINYYEAKQKEPNQDN